MKSATVVLFMFLVGCSSQPSSSPPPVSSQRLESGSIIVGGAKPKGKEKSSIGPGTADLGVRTTVYGEMRVFVSLVPKMYKFPQVPSIALQKWYGAAVVEGVIDADGVPRNVRVYESSTNRDFDSAAVAAFKSWRFHPVVIDGKPTIVVGRQHIVFQ